MASVPPLEEILVMGPLEEADVPVLLVEEEMNCGTVRHATTRDTAAASTAYSALSRTRR